MVLGCSPEGAVRLRSASSARCRSGWRRVAGVVVAFVWVVSPWHPWDGTARLEVGLLIPMGMPMG